MQYSQNLKLNDFFSKLEKENYTIVKLSDNFPNYFNGDDLDIFCENIDSFSQKILTIGNKYIKKNNCEVRIRQKNDTHYHIDFIFDKKLDLRFDLYNKLPSYKNLKLKNNLFGTILKNKTKKQQDNYFIYVPSSNEEMILRYVEFLEWFDKRPDKIKHLNFILDNTSNPITKEKFLIELHNYIKPSSKKTEPILPIIFQKIKKIFKL